MPASRPCAVLAFALLASVFALPAHAQAQRTWVSSQGDDVNPCSRTAPCRTFMVALSKTAAGGEINVIDSSAYGPVSIGKSITILAEGVTAGILAGSGGGITVKAAPTDVVILSGLAIEGSGPQAGISIVSGGAVHVSRTAIRGFRGAGGTGSGIEIAQGANTSVFVADSTILNNGAGVVAKSGSLFVDKTRVVQNQGAGVAADASGRVELSGSVVAMNTGAGLASTNGGTIVSFGNNVIYGNSPDGQPTQTLPLK